MKQELVKLTCPQCGREFYRRPCYLRQYGKYTPCCSMVCRNANIKETRAGERIQKGAHLRAENGELRLPHSRVTIRITKQIEIYPELRPEVGKTYPAEKYKISTNKKRDGYVIKSGGKRINIRADECVEV